MPLTSIDASRDLSNIAAKIDSKIINDLAAENLPTVLGQVEETAEDLLNKLKRISEYVFDEIKNFVSHSRLFETLPKINRIGTEVEKTFNTINSFPLFPILFGPIRYYAGVAQAATGSAILIIAQVGLLIAQHSEVEKSLIDKWENVVQLGLEQVILGCLNALRGAGEGLIANWTPFAIGNLILFPINHSRKFEPLFKYGTLTKECFDQGEPAIVEELQKKPVPDKNPTILILNSGQIAQAVPHHNNHLGSTSED